MEKVLTQVTKNELYLPRRFRRNVLDDDPVVGPRARRISPPASVAISEAATAASSSSAAAAAPRILGKLDADSATLEILAVEVMNGVVGIPVTNRKVKKSSKDKRLKKFKRGPVSC